ncbi:MAG: glycosyltransferase family 2 protein [Verrucomicrobiales bacterium]|nr:glycosyltransferase family 2 protein [Verrucomicrobiales bacterium]
MTESRPAFLPWLLWCYERQTYASRELVIVDSSDRCFDPGDRNDVRVIGMPVGSSIASKRNRAIREARGEIITWFDDDDWQHPQKCAWLVQSLIGGASVTGSCQAWFVHLRNQLGLPYKSAARQILFNSAGFRRSEIENHLFPANLRKASDTTWMRALDRVHRKRTKAIEGILFFWLCHDQNISNPASRRRFTRSLEELKRSIGSEAWGDTDLQLHELNERLGGGASQECPRPVKVGQRFQPARASGKKREKEQPSEAGEKIKTLPNRPSVVSDLPRQPMDRASAPSRLAQELAQAASHDRPELPPVSLMIKATVLDVPYLEVMVRHMVQQARFRFHERVLLVDQPKFFTGKYSKRNQSSETALDAASGRLLSQGWIDRICRVDYHEPTKREVLERYFKGESSRMPTHAITGGPIYATLFGMESLSTDWILQMDADVFFHTDSSSWVERALTVMAKDSGLWLMMTHPGPPVGPPGHSLTSRNARIARWDSGAQLWRFRHATTRYFVCDRRNLRTRLKPIWLRGGCAPLEQCISATLQREGVFRGTLGDLTSWHLHAWHHGDPFPQWAAELAEAIAKGRYPDRQKGEYDLRLDQAAHRAAWRRVLGTFAPAAGPSDGVPPSGGSLPGTLQGGTAKEAFQTGSEVEAERRHPKPTTANPVTATPITVLIPVRDRAGGRLRNALRSLEWQSAGPPASVLLVSHGSSVAINDELTLLCSEHGARLITVGHPSEPWNKSLALNIGIQSSSREIPHLMMMDADMILAPTFLQVVMDTLTCQPESLVLCRSSDLPQGAALEEEPEALVASLSRLRSLSLLRPRYGTGGIQVGPRTFFFDVRGYDEDFVWWGAMDGDMVARARLAGLRTVWIDDRTFMLHQWHPKKFRALTGATEVAAARQAWKRNHHLVAQRKNKARRNPRGWGMGTEPAVRTLRRA